MVETDLLKIAELAKQREEENWKFRSFLKGHCSLEPEELDALVRELTEEVAAQIDCDTCRNCCHRSPEIEMSEVPGLAAAAGMSVKDFLRKHVDRPAHEPMQIRLPCPFLRHDERTSTCTAGDAMPKACAEYPYLMKPEFWSRLMGVVEHYGECPIVFNVYERLKKRLADEFRDAEPDIDEYWEWSDD